MSRKLEGTSYLDIARYTVADILTIILDVLINLVYKDIFWPLKMYQKKHP